MKHINKIIILILVIQLVAIGLIVGTAHVQDMTLATNDIEEFNNGWSMEFEDGSVKEIPSMPFYGECDSNETVTATNVVPESLCGKTLSFLSADKTIRIFVGEQEIYSFGVNDRRLFGHTSGSVMVFADIPLDSAGKTIRMEMQSPYKNFAAYMTEMTVADRDISILHFLKNKSFDLMCCVVIFLSGIVILILASFRKISADYMGGLYSISIYLILLSVYHLIETKILTVFYGNQFLYSNLIFLILMTAPLFFEIYLYWMLGDSGKKLMKGIMVLSGVNLSVQLILQLFNLVDFLDMAFCSHGILAINIIIALVSHLKKSIKHKTISLSFIGILFMLIGATIDVLRTYIIKVGDLGKFSRYGVCIFAICEIVICVREIIRSQIAFMQKAKMEADAANLAKSQFLANMSHEIRTPINGILGMDAMLLKSCTDENQLEYARDIKSAGMTLLSIVNDILDISKIEAGKMELVPVEYNLCSVLHDCYQMNAPRAEKKELYFHMDIGKELPSGMKGDEVRIRQIINNLLSNAVKYTKTGGLTLTVTGQSGENGQDFELLISVKDTGMGMKEEDLPKLFSSFVRMDEKKNRNIEGTGLGLNLTKQLVEMMEGEITVNSEYGKGTEFQVRIPQKVTDPTPIGEWDQAYKEVQKKQSETDVSLYAPKAQILAVDDVAMNLKVLKGLLRDTGIQVDTATSGHEAIKLFEQKHFDLILLDHMMPEMDGVETLEQMKKLSGHPNTDTPVIVLTANAVVGAKEEYIKAGFTDYLTKPIFEEKLKRALKKYLPVELIETKE